MKKTLMMLLAAALVGSVMVGCGNSAEGNNGATTTEAPKDSNVTLSENAPASTDANKPAADANAPAPADANAPAADANAPAPADANKPADAGSPTADANAPAPEKK